MWIIYLAANGRAINQQKLSPLAGDFEGVISPGDAFGAALANAGDMNLDNINDLLVGAPGDDDGGTDSGAVWLLFPGWDGKVNGAQKLSPREGLLGATLTSGDRLWQRCRGHRQSRLPARDRSRGRRTVHG